MNNELPAHTPELIALRDAMNAANAASVKAARKAQIPFSTPEFKAAKAAYRAYWSAVDADALARKD